MKGFDSSKDTDAVPEDSVADELDIDIVELKREVSQRIAYRPHVKQFLNSFWKLPSQPTLRLDVYSA